MMCARTTPRYGLPNAAAGDREENIAMWVNLARKVVDEYGDYVDYWNTFNEPNVYASYGWVTAFFLPFKINPVLAGKVVQNMGKAHGIMYAYIKRETIRPTGRHFA